MKRLREEKRDYYEEKKCGTVSILIDNGKGAVLVQLRDNKPTIPYPNCYSTFGGSIDQGEKPEEAARRELKEELDYYPKRLEVVGVYRPEGYPVHLYRIVDEHIDPETIDVREGQAALLITEKEIDKLPFAFKLDQLIKDYFKKFYA